MWVKKTLFLIFWNISLKIFAQAPVGKFNKDSLQLGEVITFGLSYSHPKNTEVIFPDRSYNYKPFEFIDKNFVPTRTQGNISIDSAIYQLRSYALDSIQSLSLPVFYWQNGKKVQVFSKPVSIVFGQKPVTKWQNSNQNLPTESKINYIFLAVKSLGLGLLVLLFWLIFGKELKRQFRAFGMIRNYRDFSSGFKRNVRNYDKTGLLKGINRWKKYVGSLNGHNFMTATSTEIVTELNVPGLDQALGTIDSAVFGNQIPDNIAEAIEFLQKLAKNQYLKNRQQVLTSKT